MVHFTRSAKTCYLLYSLNILKLQWPAILCDFLVKFSALFILQIWRSTVNLSFQVRIYIRVPQETVSCLSVHCHKQKLNNSFTWPRKLTIKKSYFFSLLLLVASHICRQERTIENCEDFDQTSLIPVYNLCPDRQSKNYAKMQFDFHKKVSIKILYLLSMV